MFDFRNLKSLEYLKFQKSLRVNRFYHRTDKLKMRPEDILLENQYNLIFLDLSGNELESLPPQTLQNKTKLKFLFLARNSFDKFPDDLNSLTALEWLDFSENNIVSISKMSLNLPNLEVFNMSCNNLKYIHDNSWKFPRLMKFIYSVNKKSSGFELFDLLKNNQTVLGIVYMDYSLEALTARKDQLKSIEKLYINLMNFGAKKIPENFNKIDGMTNLKFLDLQIEKSVIDLLECITIEFLLKEYEQHPEELTLNGWLGLITDLYRLNLKFLLKENEQHLEELTLNGWSGLITDLYRLIWLNTLTLINCDFIQIEDQVKEE